MRHYFTSLEEDFLRKNVCKYDCVEITNMFNKTFNTLLNIDSIRSKMSRMELTYITKNHVYTKTEKEWIKENYDDYTYEELATLFNNVFNCNVTAEKLQEVCRCLKIHKTNNKGRFLKKQTCINAMPIGSEITDADGYTWIKINDIPYDENISANQNKLNNWILKHKYIYEQKYGVVPDDMFVIFLDKNKENFSLDNLYCVNRKIHAVMCKNRWYTCNKDNTLAALKWCELFYALNN